MSDWLDVSGITGSVSSCDRLVAGMQGGVLTIRKIQTLELIASHPMSRKDVCHLTWAQREDEDDWMLAGTMGGAGIFVFSPKGFGGLAVAHLKSFYWIRGIFLLVLRDYGLPMQLYDTNKNLSLAVDNIPAQSACCLSHDANLWVTCSPLGEHRIYSTIDWSTLALFKVELPSKCGPLCSLSMSDNDLMVVSDGLRFAALVDLRGKVTILKDDTVDVLLAPPAFSPGSEYIALCCASSLRVIRPNGTEVFCSEHRAGVVTKPSTPVHVLWNASGTQVAEMVGDTCFAVRVARGQVAAWRHVLSASWSESDPETISLLFPQEVRLWTPGDQENTESFALPLLAKGGSHCSVSVKSRGELLVADGGEHLLLTQVI